MSSDETTEQIWRDAPVSANEDAEETALVVWLEEVSEPIEYPDGN